MNTSSTVTTDAPTRWTRQHILLHWIGAGLVAVQFALGGSMSALFRQSVGEGLPGATATVLGVTHMAVGSMLFLAVVARLLDRLRNGRPPHPPGEPTWAQRLAALTQTLLYATVIAMPVAGMLAWFTQDVRLASLHALAAKALLALLALHIGGALANHYWFKTDVLVRMLPGQGRDAKGETAALTEERR